MNFIGIVHDSSMTESEAAFGTLHTVHRATDLQRLRIIAFTHKKTPLRELNRFFLHEENRRERLEYVKFSCDLGEILYLATCNRIEFLFTSQASLNESFLTRFFRSFREDWQEEELNFAVAHAEVFEDEEALLHFYSVASSLDSLVVGEREIITQVRKAYDACHSEGLTSDFLRLVVKSTITTAKKVYTETRIANNPISIVSLAERKLRALHPSKQSRILLVGAGETITNISKYLVKQGFRNFSIFNRSLENSRKLAGTLQSSTVSAAAYSLDDLKTFNQGFDILITSTSAADPIITTEIYTSLLSKDPGKKILVDLAIPADIHSDVIEQNPVHFIDINDLRKIAQENLAGRQREYEHAAEIVEECVRDFRQLHRTRALELKMREVPVKIREIKDRAVNDVFARELESLDENSRELLGKMLDYMEKKCISIPMIMAKEIILETSE